MQDHGGNLDVAIARFGGCAEDWIDLSTGINRRPYPVGEVPPHRFHALPSRADLAALHNAARQAYATKAPVAVLGGAQAAIQLLPHLARPGRARVLQPTYNEYAATLRAADWQVEEVGELDALAGCDLAVIVNPNNPDGRRHDPRALLALSSRVGRLVVDESFADAVPGLSLAQQAGRLGLLVLRSFGKFYGLAGLRLGFALGCEADIAALNAMAGPWPISGAAIEIGQRALRDRDWAAETTARLAHDSLRLDDLALDAGWELVGGTPLFRLYQPGDARTAQAQLVRARIWPRFFSERPLWLRLGLPGSETEWRRLAAALSRFS
jgi:cobalamin biosynthetic protein CobC